MLKGRMMDMPMMISSIIDYAADVRTDNRIVSNRVEGDIHRYTYAEARARSVQMAHALKELGIKQGDRVATMAWNGYRHFELYFAISGIGAVCHTINPRLFAEQIIYVTNHAEDRILFLDTTFIPVITPLLDQLPKDMRFVLMCDRASMPDCALPNPLCYEDLISGQPTDIVWPVFDERAASSLCYTSGTTGNPKGVLYSHRSTYLHSMGMLTLAGEAGVTAGASLLPVVPLFHANAWGTPYVAPLVGANMVFPGAKLDGVSVFELMDQEKVSSAWGVPTVWLGVLAEMRKRGRKPEGFEVVLSGGSAVARSMIREFEDDYGVRVIHGWGMTEMSPVGSTSIFGPLEHALPRDKQLDLKMLQGRRMFTVDARIVDEEGKTLAHDGEAFGELQVRGHAVIDGYHADEKASAAAITGDGWLRTGDVAKIDPRGFIQLVDRTKDVIKSGGEWISSIDLENAALGHPAIAECAVIAMPHPKWDERPMLIARLEEGKSLTAKEVNEFLADKVAKWWLPDDVVFVDDLPHTATGKLSKLTLRERFKDHVLPTAAE
jgi:acyl-CoA synthetase (AMP-forming)/AMP-acid ligase II